MCPSTMRGTGLQHGGYHPFPGHVHLLQRLPRMAQANPHNISLTPTPTLLYHHTHTRTLTNAFSPPVTLTDAPTDTHKLTAHQHTNTSALRDYTHVRTTTHTFTHTVPDKHTHCAGTCAFLSTLLTPGVKSAVACTT